MVALPGSKKLVMARRLSKNLAITTAAAAKRKPGRHPDLRGDAALTF
jgi:hypothetical protein